MQRDVSARFWAKVDRTGECWVWTGARFRDRRGGETYGMFLFRGTLWHASRVSWTLTRGEVPAGQLVLHSCDNPPCVRPDHLSLGTHRKNMDEMVERLRYTHGRAHHSNVLTEDQVRTIKRRLLAGEPIAPMAREYGVTYTAIYFIAIGRNWRWLDAA